jgi:hypothetical protein
MINIFDLFLYFRDLILHDNQLFNDYKHDFAKLYFFIFFFIFLSDYSILKIYFI